MRKAHISLLSLCLASSPTDAKKEKRKSSDAAQNQYLHRMLKAGEIKHDSRVAQFMKMQLPNQRTCFF